MNFWQMSTNRQLLSLAQQKKTKKTRNKPYTKGKDEELIEMRKKGKALCSCWEQWRSISKYKKERLKDWIEQKEYDSDKTMQNSVFTLAIKTYGTVLDYLAKGDGHISKNIEADISLRSAIEEECSDWVKYLSNKSKIAFLTSSNVYHGKMEERALNINKATIEEIIPLPIDDDEIMVEQPTDVVYGENADTDEDYHETANDAGENIGTEDDNDIGYEEGDNEFLPLSEGEETMQTQDATLPSSD